MYIPEVFAEHDIQEVKEMIRSIGLATLVTSSSEGLLATPMPFLYKEDENELGTLHGHIARANPQWKHEPVGDAMVIFQGANAYVSPAWYPSKTQNGRVVPTWNYIAVHAYGPVEFFDDSARLLEIVSSLTDSFESGRAERWGVKDAPEEYVKAQLRGIIGVRIPIRRFDAKKKLSQNQPAANRLAVKETLSGSDRAEDRAIAALMPE